MTGCVKRAVIAVGVPALAVLYSTSAYAFGTRAHLIVGYIADAHICASTRVVVASMLEGSSLAEAGLWADKIRGYSQWDYARPWHYMNVPDGVAITAADQHPGGDVLSAIEEMNRRLRDAALDQQAQVNALRFLVHFVADIHQPLHVGLREDLGGNKVQVSYEATPGKRPKRVNLHQYWDSGALDTVVEDPQAYAAALMEQMIPDQADWQAGTPEDWAYESKTYRSEVYDFAVAEGGEPVWLDAAYRAKALDILDQRLVLAGLRLAASLDALYCTAGGLDPKAEKSAP
jgi:hypothetical protein